MKDYYSILDIPKNANKKDIHKSYLRLVNGVYAIGNTDLENMRAPLLIKEFDKAYETLGSSSNRLLYDVKKHGKVECIESNFTDKSDIDEFVESVKDAISYLSSDINEKSKSILKLNSRIESLIEQSLDEKVDFAIQIETEKSKSSDMEGVISDHLNQIDSLTNQLNILKDMSKEKERADNQTLVIEKQNIHLLKIAHNHKNFMFKLITIMSFSFLFIILLVYLNS